ncbi:hypothetical protein [Branchiibius hedensis]|uniref:hypothetical protein n=1 Tax=Branchiibius hedensis TaxID=672460 RepID=UPI0015AF2208|nr:hypothetical protein [Branchiibius hedensis]
MLTALALVVFVAAAFFAPVLLAVVDFVAVADFLAVAVFFAAAEGLRVAERPAVLAVVADAGLFTAGILVSQYAPQIGRAIGTESNAEPTQSP